MFKGRLKMGNFTAKLELPRFIPKEQILGKQVLDSEVLCIGLVEDWTYSSEGEIKMVVKIESEDKSNSTVTIPFSYIERVGQFVLLTTSRNQFIEKLKEQTDSEGEKKVKKENLENNQSKYFNEIDEKKIERLAEVLPKQKKKKSSKKVSFAEEKE
jgi:sporulation protein YlmC with PRC-barrel domain